MGNDDRAEILIVQVCSIFMLFSHGEYEFRNRFQNTCIRLIEGITATVVGQVKAYNSGCFHRKSWLFHTVPPHHATIWEAM